MDGILTGEGMGGEKKSHPQNSSLFALVFPFRHFDSRQLHVSLALVLSKDRFVVVSSVCPPPTFTGMYFS